MISRMLSKEYMAQQTFLDQETALVIHFLAALTIMGCIPFREEYIPALEMTIITSYPEVEFIYTGTPNYVPPKKEPDSPALNVTI